MIFHIWLLSQDLCKYLCKKNYVLKEEMRKSFGDHIQVSTGLLNQALMLFFFFICFYDFFMSFGYFFGFFFLFKNYVSWSEELKCPQHKTHGINIKPQHICMYLCFVSLFYYFKFFIFNHHPLHNNHKKNEREKQEKWLSPGQKSIKRQT